MDSKNTPKPEHTPEQIERLIEQQAQGEAPNLDVSLTDLDEADNGELDDRRSKFGVQTCAPGIMPCQG